MCSNFSRLSSIENQLDSKTISNIQEWLDGTYDSATKEQIISLQGSLSELETLKKEEEEESES